MRKHFLLWSLIALLAFASYREIQQPPHNIPPTPQVVTFQASTDNKQYDYDRISHDIVNPTVQLVMDDGSGGTGVVLRELAEGSLIITAYHVVRGAKTIRAQQTIEGHTHYGWNLTINIFDEDNDLAILNCNRKWAGVAAFINDPNELKQFVPAFTYGYPGGREGLLEGILSHGFVSCTKEEGFTTKRIVTTTSIPVALGNSGGGLFVFVNGKWKHAGVLSMVLVQPFHGKPQMVNNVSAFTTAKCMLDFISQLK